ncbi:MAG: DUF1963 domain-containing protein [Hyphomicrobiaceae bacterium]
MFDQMFETDAEPAIWLHRTTEHRRSKFGGLPNLPWWISWPRRQYTAARLVEEFAELNSLSERARKLLANASVPLANAAARNDRPPMHFLAQIDLSELPALPLEPGGPSLPSTGFLFFFANIAIESAGYDWFGDHWMETEEDDGSDTRVIYSRSAGPERQSPKRLPPLASEEYNDYPADDAIWSGVFPAHPMAAKRFRAGEEDIAPPPYQQTDPLELELLKRDWIASRFEIDVPVTSVDWQDWARYPVAMQEFRREIEGVERVTKRELHWVRHQMFGLSPTIQYERGSTRHATDRNGEPAIPLMTFDTDWGVHKEFQFCDYGLLQFWIKPNDLAARRFDRCYATTEGG